jgi:hypothetical protein
VIDPTIGDATVAFRGMEVLQCFGYASVLICEGIVLLEERLKLA